MSSSVDDRRVLSLAEFLWSVANRPLNQIISVMFFGLLMAGTPLPNSSRAAQKATLSGHLILDENSAAKAASSASRDDGDLDDPRIASRAAEAANLAGELAFTNITAASNFADDGDGGHGAAFADVDQDGLPDLYITSLFQDTGPRADHFYRNAGDNIFVDESVARGIDDFDGGSHGLAWADFDNDGDYDLINGTTWSETAATYGSPAANSLYKNDGAANFTEMISPDVLGSKIETRAVIAFDMDGDGDLDLFGVPGRQSPGINEAFTNAGDFVFNTHTGGDLSTAIAMQGATDTDFDRDGDIDVLAANRLGNFAILENDGTGVFATIDPSTLGFTHSAGDGITTADVDNDGDLDILLVTDGTGYLYFRERDGNYSHKQTFAEGDGYMGGFADLDNDGDLDLVIAGDDLVYINHGAGDFGPGPAVPVAGINDPRAIAFADIDDDGDLDFAIAAKRSNTWLVRNDFNSGNWLKVKLVSSLGQAGAFGAKTFVYPVGATGGTQIGLRESKSNNGYLGQDDPLLHFGLGDHLTVDVVVQALDGTQTIVTNVPANRTVVIIMN